jgi:hypothetical protein
LEPKRNPADIRAITPTEDILMKSILFAAGILLAGSAAQAEIVCTQHGGCHETGMKLIYGDGGGVTK